MPPEREHFSRDATGNGQGASRSVRSGFVTVIGRGAQLAIQLGLVVILARILTPEDFGLQSMVFPIALLAQGIANSGLQSAIIQHEDLDDVQASALFWVSLRWNALLCIGMAVAGMGLAALYRDARVIGVSAVWAAVIFGATLSAIHEALLKRQFRFGAVLGAHLAGLVLSVIVAVVAASLGARYWAIILQMAVVEFVRVAIMWVICRWRPLSPAKIGSARESAARELQAYWRGFAGARVVSWIGEQSDRLVVGAIGGAQVAGLYEFAKRWGSFAFLEPYNALSEVAIASLSSVRKDPALFAQYVRNAFLPVLAVSLPIVGFLFAESRGVLLFLFGARWLEAAPMLQAIAVAIALASIARLALWVPLSTGQTERQFRWTGYSTPVFLAAVLVGARWGAIGVALGMTIASLLTSVPAVFYLLAKTTLEPMRVLQVWAVPFAASAGAVVSLHFLGAVLPGADRIAGLLVRGVVFVVCYAVLFVVLPGGRGMLRTLLHRTPDARPPSSD